MNRCGNNQDKLCCRLGYILSTKSKKICGAERVLKGTPHAKKLWHVVSSRLLTRNTFVICETSPHESFHVHCSTKYIPHNSREYHSVQ